MGVRDSLLGKLLGNADTFTDEQVLQTVNLLIERGVELHATDIHIEPGDRTAIIRYRIHGMLRVSHKLPMAALPTVVSQLKQLAHMDPDITAMPQEGRYATIAGGRELELGVSTLPVVSGEKIVIHINRQLNTPPKLEAIGFYGKTLSHIENALSQPSGLVLVAAPRKSGKTTVTHSMLSLLLNPVNSIATIESAIDFRLPGASQTRIVPGRGLTFHQALRAVMQQDANIILISDLPDRQTVDAALHAATRGHLVIAGVACDDAVTGLLHVRSFTTEPLLLASSLRAVVGHRLVRVLCRQCRKPYTLDETQYAHIRAAFGLKAADMKKLHDLEIIAKKAGLGQGLPLSTTPSSITTLWQADDDGCQACNCSGYIGAFLINEVITPTDSLRHLLLKDTPQKSAVYTQALSDGFTPLLLDGLVKALRGETTINEVMQASIVS